MESRNFFLRSSSLQHPQLVVVPDERFPPMAIISLPQSHLHKNKDFTIVDAQKIESLYPTLSLNEGFKHFCSQHKFVIVQNNIKKLRSGKSLEPFIPTAQDNDLSCGLYVYDKINGQPIQLINVCKRPDGFISHKQLNDTNPIELTNELYHPNLFDKNSGITKIFKKTTELPFKFIYHNFMFIFPLL